MAKMYARELLVYPSDYDKFSRLNRDRIGENWGTLAKLLPQHTGAAGFTCDEIESLRLEDPNYPIRAILRAWLPQNTATCKALCIALRRVLADDIVDALGIGSYFPPLMAADIFKTQADFDKLSPLTTAPGGHNWELVASYLTQESGLQGFTWQETAQAASINHANPLAHLMTIWLPQKTATRRVLSQALKKTGNYQIIDKLGLCYIQDPSPPEWTYDAVPEKSKAVQVTLFGEIPQKLPAVIPFDRKIVEEQKRLLDECDARKVVVNQEKSDLPKDSSEEEVCAICFVNKKNCVVLDCGHVSFCYSCVESFVNKPCPVCNQTIIRVVKTYDV